MKIILLFPQNELSDINKTNLNISKKQNFLRYYLFIKNISTNRPKSTVHVHAIVNLTRIQFVEGMAKHISMNVLQTATKL